MPVWLEVTLAIGLCVWIIAGFYLSFLEPRKP